MIQWLTRTITSLVPDRKVFYIIQYLKNLIKKFQIYFSDMFGHILMAIKTSL